MKKTLVTILILNYLSYDLTISLIRSLKMQQSRLDINYLIVDNASPNESFKELQTYFKDEKAVTVIQSPTNGGYAKGNNYGLRFMELNPPEYVLIINNDVKFNLSVLERCVEVDKSVPNVGMIAPVQCLPDGKVASTVSLKIHSFWDDVVQYLGGEVFLPKIKYYSNCDYPDMMRVGIIPGSFIFTKFSKIKRVDYFDESTFLFCEEHFIARRYHSINLKNYIITDATYIHEHSKTIKSVHSIRQQFRLLLDSQRKYAKRYYKFPTIEIPILTFLNCLYSNLLCLFKSLHRH